MNPKILLSYVGVIATVGSVLLFAEPAEKVPAAGDSAAKPVETSVKIRNEKVIVTEVKLAPDEIFRCEKDKAAVVVYLDDGRVTTSAASGMSRDFVVKRGNPAFLPVGIVRLKNRGLSPLRLVRIEFVGQGSSEVWSTTGLAPHYTLWFENQYARVYEIRIAAGMEEPMHTHHQRVVVGLSGADLEHILPDGRHETSSLKTDEIAWRAAATHVGRNIGKTDLWAMAIEPK